MIRKTIYPQANSHISTISKSYWFSEGTATVRLDSMGNYELLVNGMLNSRYENSAKRDVGYKAAVKDVSLKMMQAFEQRDAAFTTMHKKVAKLKGLSDKQSQIDALHPNIYKREIFPLKKPKRSEVIKELEDEAAILFNDLYKDQNKERIEYVNKKEYKACYSRCKAYEEVQSFFEQIQDLKEAKANEQFQKEYERHRQEIENYIIGEKITTENNIKAIISEIELPFRVEIECDYQKNNSLLTTDIEFYGDKNLPRNKTSILSSGKISIKEKLAKEFEQLKTETIISMVYYVAASLFNASINIQTQRVTVWLNGKVRGFLWVQFDRDKFTKMSFRNLNPLQNYYDFPHVDSLRMVRGALQFDMLKITPFKKSIECAIKENQIDNTNTNTSNSFSETDGPEWIVTIGYAKTLLDILPNDVELRSIISKAEAYNISEVSLPKRYKGIYKELKR